MLENWGISHETIDFELLSTVCALWACSLLGAGGGGGQRGQQPRGGGDDVTRKFCPFAQISICSSK